MELAILEKVREKGQESGVTSQNMETGKCRKCQGTGWVESNRDSYRRCECVEIKRIKENWEKYGIKPEEVKPLRDYISYHKICFMARQKAFDYVTGYSEFDCQGDNWFGVFGQSGAGKSHIVIAMGAALLTREDRPVKVVYMPYLETMRKLKARTMDEAYYTKLLYTYQKAELLVIDDLFKDKIRNNKLAFQLTEADIKHIYPIINYRYFNKMPTLVSSECTPNMLLDLDEALGGRILESCGDNITVFVGEEFNYRMRRFERSN